jgi:hypothetical protein
MGREKGTTRPSPVRDNPPLGEFYYTSDRNPLKRASELSKVPTGNPVRANQLTNAMVTRDLLGLRSLQCGVLLPKCNMKRHSVRGFAFPLNARIHSLHAS